MSLDFFKAQSSPPSSSIWTCNSISLGLQNQRICMSQATFLFISLDKGVSNCSLLGLRGLLFCLTPPSQALPTRHGTWWLAASGAFVSSVELSARNCEDTWDNSSYQVLLKHRGLDEGLSGSSLLAVKIPGSFKAAQPSLPSTKVLMRSSDFTIMEILLGQSWGFTREA